MKNKKAFGRYVVIDNCFRTGRRFSLDQLAEACENSLIVGLRPEHTTLEHDFVFLRNEFNAPIKGGDGLFYYTDKTYSFFNLGMTKEHSDFLVELLVTLKQFSFLPQHEKLGEVIFTLEQKAGLKGDFQRNVIEFDNTQNTGGTKHLKFIYESILANDVIEFDYIPYKGEEAKVMTVHPYFLKESNRRWFLIGRNNETNFKDKFGLDRIIGEIKVSPVIFKPTSMDFNAHFSDFIGVSKVPGIPKRKIILSFDRKRANYVLTKPLHHSQRVLEDYNLDSDRVYISINVIPNRELIKELLGFGKHIEVIKPPNVRKMFYENALEMVQNNRI